MRCSKCGTESPDTERFCPVCGHKLQSERPNAPETPTTENAGPRPADEPRRLLDFQGWTTPRRGLGRYLEACLYAVILVAGVTYCLLSGRTWPLYPLIAGLALVAWLRRL